jgi:hypothetical protein
MELKNEKIESDEVKIIYLDLLDSFGFYRINLDQAPYVCLNTSLLDYGFKVLHQEVFNLLLERHRAIPEDSPYRWSEQCDYYEDLLPAVKTYNLQPEPELAFMGRAIVKERVFTRRDQMRIIGGSFRGVEEAQAG